MKEVRFFYVPNALHEIELPADEAQHATRVLRLQAGDEIFLLDGIGNFIKAQVNLVSSKRCTYQITEIISQSPTWKGHIHIAIAPTKMTDRVEWMLEKITEIGFDEITFLDCQYSIRRQLRVDRLEKIVISAMKQSRKSWKPIVNSLTKFSDFINNPPKGQLFIAHCYNEIARNDLFNIIQKNNRNQDITILIGPEGDFSIQEVEQAIQRGFQSISLGNNRLRTETAGLFAVSMAQLANRIE